MCGINGIISEINVPSLEYRIKRMNQSLEHRGPDNSGYLIENKKIALGHTRLSIIDITDVSNQPMVSNSNRWHITYNGEIYNFKNIKNQLNYKFLTNSDTEVILAAVEEKGIDWFLKEANGMFAVALYDKVKDELTVIRDRLGIKPLYYYYKEGLFIFSSEIKGILNSGLVNSVFNKKAVDEYLANRYIRAPYTFFEHIFQINPGTYKTIKKDFSISTKTYWKLPLEFNQSSSYDEKEILDFFEKEVTKAIKSRLVSDVELGTYLSGGIDSSLITAIVAANKKEKINTYTIGFSELNEFQFAKKIEKQYDTEHHEITTTKQDYIKEWEKLIEFKDAPLAVPNEIPLYLMSKKLKEKITVVLSGEGADELMGGYGRIYRSPFDFKNHVTNAKFYDYFIEQYEYVNRDIRDEFINTPKDYRYEFDNIIRKKFSNKSNEENVFRFFHSYHVQGLLQRVDLATMSNSVEARVPFLDHKLIEYCYKEIPYNLKLRWKNYTSENIARKLNSKNYSEELDTPKYLLKKIALKYMSNEIVNRRKMGFPVPLTEWFNDLEEISQHYLKKAEWLLPGKIDDLILKSKQDARAGQVLWMFINIEIFKQKYFTNDCRY